MDELAVTLFDCAARIAQDRVGFDEAPAELVIAVESATGLELADAVTVAKLILRGMFAMRAVDLRLMEIES
jgi:hypothetical protein